MVAATAGPEAQERRMGECLVCWDVRVDAAGGCSALLQARHEVRSASIARLYSSLMQSL